MCRTAMAMARDQPRPRTTPPRLYLFCYGWYHARESSGTSDLDCLISSHLAPAPAEAKPEGPRPRPHSRSHPHPHPHPHPHNPDPYCAVPHFQRDKEAGPESSRRRTSHSSIAACTQKYSTVQLGPGCRSQSRPRALPSGPLLPSLPQFGLLVRAGAQTSVTLQPSLAGRPHGSTDPHLERKKRRLLNSLCFGRPQLVAACDRVCVLALTGVGTDRALPIFLVAGGRDDGRLSQNRL